MRARVAYISSFGTTAILVAAALLMLAVVGAIVTFRGWPGSANAAGVQSVPLGPSLQRARATPVVARVNRAGRGVVRTRTAAAVTRRLSTAGLVKQVGPRVVPGLVMVPVATGPPLRSAFPQPSRPGPTFPAPSGRNPAIGSLPAEPSRSAPVDPAELVPIQVPNTGAPPPSADELSAAVDQLVAQAPPPPSLPR